MATDQSIGSSPGPLTRTPSISTAPQKQPLNMEALAAKFADSKENKEKFAKLQLSPALAPAVLPDKERRAPMGSFVAPSSASSHMAHIKVQRTASLNQSSQSTLLPKSPGSSRLQPGHLAQSTDMRRTASHNNAFSSGLGLPLGPMGGAGGLEHSNGFSGAGLAANNYGNSNVNHAGNALGGSSAQLAPFSLSQMTRSPRRSSFNPPDHTSYHQHDQGSATHNLLPSPLMADKHPLQHAW
ncbi:hypothetical protein EDD11_003503 [Mortierella claussenii]|nr:hypothetical protein EDD11_003503 [Mortierella claussenii]